MKRWSLRIRRAAGPLVVLFALAGTRLAADSGNPGWSDACGEDDRPTILGLFNPQSPVSANRMGAQAVRFIIVAANLDNGIAPIADRLATYRQAGFRIVATVAHWNGEKRGPLPLPGSPEWLHLLDNFEAFLLAAGPVIDVCSLDNEPMFDLAPTDFVPDAAGRVPAIEWYHALAERAQQVIRHHPQLAHVRVSAPALNEISQEAEGGAPLGGLIRLLLDWENGDRNIDLVDVHLHVAGLPDIEAALGYLHDRTAKRLIVTEWSQADAVRAWLGQPVDPAFAALFGLSGAMTNTDFVVQCYAAPVGKGEWDEFVALAPYDPAFMGEAFAAMERGRVVLAAYGAEIQFGNPVFDTKQLLADLTVVPDAAGNPQENYLFGSWYRAVAQQAAAAGR